MWVQFLVRPDLEQHPGGDTVQIQRTAEELRVLGVDVHVDTELPRDSQACDIVHLFHLDRLWENLPHIRRLQTRPVPAALSPIWWPGHEFDERGRTGSQGLLARLLGAGTYPSVKVLQRSLASWVRSGLRLSRRPVLGFDRGVRALLDGVGVLLPNSEQEAELITQRFGSRPTRVVPNGADAEFFTPDPDPAAEERRAGVTCVGRIEPRKNQLALIRALRGTGLPLTIIGKAGRFSEGYERACRREAGPDVAFLGSQSRVEVRDHLRRALVHACPSWYETPGLATLEALLCGCRIVATRGGCTEEYFGKHAHYGAPDDPDSLRRAVLDALGEGVLPGRRDECAERFNWTRAARETLCAYHDLLNGRTSHGSCS